MYCICRSPSWGAWIEIPVIPPSPKDLSVAPPRGERGLKFSFGAALPPLARRSPSWGAWIEIVCVGVYGCVINCRSPSWGAWIEISYGYIIQQILYCRSPSWGAWIEMLTVTVPRRKSAVAPPRGERGLKYQIFDCRSHADGSLPLVGSVD